MRLSTTAPATGASLSTKTAFQAGSISYREAGATIRLALQRATQERITSVEWRVLAAVIHLTLSWSKAFDRTYVAAVAETAQLDQTDRTLKKTKRALRSLSEKGIISYDPATRSGAMTVVGIHPEQTRLAA